MKNKAAQALGSIKSERKAKAAQANGKKGGRPVTIYRLYDIPRESRIKAETRDDQGNKLGDYIIFHHVDGMYSYCTVEGKPDQVCHLGVGEQLRKVRDHYELYRPIG